MVTTMNKDDSLRSCMRKVESDRRQLRGEPDLLRKHYWSEVEAMFARVVDFARNSGSDVSVGKAPDVATFLLSVSRSASITSVRAKRPELLDFGLTALAMENMQQDYRETMIELYLLDH